MDAHFAISINNITLHWAVTFIFLNPNHSLWAGLSFPGWRLKVVDFKGEGVYTIEDLPPVWSFTEDASRCWLNMSNNGLPHIFMGCLGVRP